MDPIALYRKFSQEFFYNFHKHSTDLELDELGKKYSTCLEKNSSVIYDILEGNKHPDELRSEARQDLEFLAKAEAKFAKELPLDIKGEHFEIETDFSRMPGKLRRLVDGRSHLVRLIKPSEYDRNYWFYTGGDSPPQNIFCSEFGLDMIEYLKGFSLTAQTNLSALRKAIAFQKDDVYQFWTLAPYVHHNFMELGYSWDMSMTTLLQIASQRYAQEGQPFAGHTYFQLGYDERMPTHLIARMEAMRDVAFLKSGEYTKKYNVELPDRLADAMASD
jgi:hypothetical protein